MVFCCLANILTKKNKKDEIGKCQISNVSITLKGLIRKEPLKMLIPSTMNFEDEYISRQLCKI